MRLFKPLLLSAALLTACQTSSLNDRGSVSMAEAEANSERGALINRTEVVAVVSSNDVASDLEQKAAHWGYSLKRKEALNGLGLFVLTFDCPPGIDPHVASRELEKLAPKSDVGANHRYSFQTSKVSKISGLSMPRQYANALIEWPEEGCAPFASVGMIDGGIAPDAEILRTGYVESKSFVNTISSEGLEHGTAVAEILIGPGRLRGAKLYSASVVGTDPDGNTYSGVEPMLKALDWMVKSDVRVVNFSMAGPYNRALQRGINRALDKGVVIVAAVGNSGAKSAPQFPAAFPGVIAATAVDADGEVYERAVRGPHVDVAGPGVDVWVGEQNRYLTGTSVAAPFIAALIASNQNLTSAKNAKQLRERLTLTSYDLGEVGTDSTYGVGLLHVDQGCRTG